MPCERFFNVVLRKRYARLEKIFRRGAQIPGFTPVQPRADDECVETVILRASVEDGAEGVFDKFLDAGRVNRSAEAIFCAEIMHPEGGAFIARRD